MKKVAILGLVVLAGCNTPPREFGDVVPQTVVVEQSTFDVRIKGNRAHALRTNREYAPNFVSVAPRAQVAIEQASGYSVKPGTLAGDQVFITAVLQC